MKSIMYHYVREFNKEIPYLRFLDIKNFKKQLDYFEEKYGFVSREEWENSIVNKNYENYSNKIILTFDDALFCHFKYVLPELINRKIWGIFYIPSAPYIEDRILDVHKIHLLSGVFNSETLLNTTYLFIKPYMVLLNSKKRFENKVYKMQNNSDNILKFKKLFNYFIKEEFRSKILDKIASHLNFNFNLKNFYISEKQIIRLKEKGMIIGAHTHNHKLLSSLTYEQQKKEIDNSFEFLNNIGISGLKTFCYPYGGEHSYNKNTIKYLKKLNVDFTFSVENKDIEINDLKNHVQNLPRYNCNFFRFGKAS